MRQCNMILGLTGEGGEPKIDGQRQSISAWRGKEGDWFIHSFCERDEDSKPALISLTGDSSEAPSHLVS